MDVASLVQQMHDNLSEIHKTVASFLSVEEHDARLNALEQKRDSLLADLRKAYEKERAELDGKRQSESDEIIESRRREDEERERRRRQEDEELQASRSREDEERQKKLDGDMDAAEDETELEMDRVEEEARQTVENGEKQLRDLEEKRREINRMIDEQLKMPLPTAPTRKRERTRRNRAVNGAGSEGLEPSSTRSLNAAAVSEEPVNNSEKAPDAESAADATRSAPAANSSSSPSNEVETVTAKAVEAEPEAKEVAPETTQPEESPAAEKEESKEETKQPEEAEAGAPAIDSSAEPTATQIPAEKSKVSENPESVEQAKEDDEAKAFEPKDLDEAPAPTPVEASKFDEPQTMTAQAAEVQSEEEAPTSRELPLEGRQPAEAPKDETPEPATLPSEPTATEEKSPPAEAALTEEAAPTADAAESQKPEESAPSDGAGQPISDEQVMKALSELPEEEDSPQSDKPVAPHDVPAEETSAAEEVYIKDLDKEVSDAPAAADTVKPTQADHVSEPDESSFKAVSVPESDPVDAHDEPEEFPIREKPSEESSVAEPSAGDDSPAMSTRAVKTDDHDVEDTPSEAEGVAPPHEPTLASIPEEAHDEDGEPTEEASEPAKHPELDVPRPPTRRDVIPDSPTEEEVPASRELAPLQEDAEVDKKDAADPTSEPLPSPSGSDSHENNSTSHGEEETSTQSDELNSVRGDDHHEISAADADSAAVPKNAKTETKAFQDDKAEADAESSEEELLDKEAEAFVQKILDEGGAITGAQDGQIVTVADDAAAAALDMVKDAPKANASLADPASETAKHTDAEEKPSVTESAVAQPESVSPAPQHGDHVKEEKERDVDASEVEEEVTKESPAAATEVASKNGDVKPHASEAKEASLEASEEPAVVAASSAPESHEEESPVASTDKDKPSTDPVTEPAAAEQATAEPAADEPVAAKSVAPETAVAEPTAEAEPELQASSVAQVPEEKSYASDATEPQKEVEAQSAPVNKEKDSHPQQADSTHGEAEHETSHPLADDDEVHLDLKQAAVAAPDEASRELPTQEPEAEKAKSDDKEDVEIPVPRDLDAEKADWPEAKALDHEDEAPIAQAAATDAAVAEAPATKVIPEETAAEEAAPEKAAPAEATPAEVAPKEAAPTETAFEQDAPAESVAEEVVPTENADQKEENAPAKEDAKPDSKEDAHSPTESELEFLQPTVYSDEEQFVQPHDGPSIVIDGPEETQDAPASKRTNADEATSPADKADSHSAEPAHGVPAAEDSSDIKHPAEASVERPEPEASDASPATATKANDSPSQKKVEQTKPAAADELADRSLPKEEELKPTVDKAAPPEEAEAVSKEAPQEVTKSDKEATPDEATSATEPESIMEAPASTEIPLTLNAALEAPQKNGDNVFDAADASEHVGTDANAAPKHAEDGSDHSSDSEHGHKEETAAADVAPATATTTEAHPVASEHQPSTGDAGPDGGVEQDGESHAHPSEEATGSVDVPKQDVHAASIEQEETPAAKQPTESAAEVPATETPATQEAPAISVQDDHSPESIASDKAGPKDSATEAPTEPAAANSAPEHDDQLTVEPPSRQASRSPLPVETGTMQGHEDLFDDDDSPSSAEDHDDVKESTLDYSPEEHDDGPPTAKLSPGAQPNNSSQSLGQELGDDFGDSDDEHDEHGESLATPTVAQFGKQLGQHQEFQPSQQGTDDQFKTPSLAPVSQATTSDVSPIALHHPQPTSGTPNGGLADSVHAPQQSREQAVSTPTNENGDYDDEEAFMMPRDVTNVPWHARNDSVPASMRSFSTVDDSITSSPVHSALLADRHEPVIRDSWPSMPGYGGGGRARGISQLTESSAGGGAHEEFDPFRYDVSSSGKPAPPPAPTSWAGGVNAGNGGGFPTPPASNRYDSVTPPPQERSVSVNSNRNSISGGNGPASSPMFAKLRSMFEPIGGQQQSTPPTSTDIGGGSGTSSPSRSRSASSSIFQPTPRDRSSSLRKSLNAADLFNMANNNNVYDQVPQEDEEGEHLHEKSSLLAGHPEGSSSSNVAGRG